MTKFARKSKGKRPGIPTASLPDIVFMLLFFFMVTTVLRETNLKLNVSPPFASEIKKLEKKSLVSYIYIGKPLQKEVYGTAPRIQLNDAFATKEKIREFISSEREKMTEADRKKMTVSIKCDKNIEMGIVTDVKEELKKASALKVNYSSRSGTQREIFSNF
jgi:biopolymer transport protein ExbD